MPLRPCSVWGACNTINITKTLLGRRAGCISRVDLMKVAKSPSFVWNETRREQHQALPIERHGNTLHVSNTLFSLTQRPFSLHSFLTRCGSSPISCQALTYGIEAAIITHFESNHINITQRNIVNADWKYGFYQRKSSLTKEENLGGTTYNWYRLRRFFLLMLPNSTTPWEEDLACS
jgi:hypothetical protein